MKEKDIDLLIARARTLADEFDLIGNAKAAETIRSLCRSRESARENNKRLWRDNEDLRRRAGLGD